MKRSGLAVAIILSFGPCCVGQTPTSATAGSAISDKPVFTITLAPPIGPIRIGSPIVVTVTVTNVSGKDIYLGSDRGKNAAYKDFGYLLTKDGQQVETTVFHRRITGQNRADDPPQMESSSSIVLSHPPGKIFVMKVDLNRLYKISEPGVYTLVASQFDDYSKTTVRSDPLILTVVP
jgi:hypothetical protein